ncbi:Hypothetical protein FKW44_008627 [Caligus rogercresseyi]|uniref:Uncharacterized protein n=2 Tax=Caligus rogercresseyi TaxID=217165 RepID=A0A7T8QUE4_CALRO|nr:Hypothetical protein FKW44_024913 [Caligus rogercresseyi]QQP38834.1 Hypothetical protein FKW44_019526 [Caligus rogercresseyi]QQP42174.1 Hypothetical protein FKW44_016755 [Caligus rogercresseyi]QQP51369.1 Hypothetical protein FKW44_012709 [Caligus rogercresseyi]QQP55445.1 Hypothetical protein FKW44_008627 [Caligus rogercresseyi]
MTSANANNSLYNDMERISELKNTMPRFNGQQGSNLNMFISNIERIQKVQEISDANTAELAHSYMTGEVSE